jgi:hypothetical protein
MFEAEHAGVGAAQPIVDTLAALGYKMYRLVPALMVLVPVHQFTDSKNQSLDLNVFCCKDDKAMRLAEQGLLVLETSLITARSSADFIESGFWDLPYAQALRDRWQATASDPLRSQLEAAIADFYASQDLNQSIAERYAALLDSYKTLSGLCRQDASRLRTASLIRVAFGLFSRLPFEVRSLQSELNSRLMREGCFSCVTQGLLDLVMRNSNDAIADLVAEPFLVGLPRYDREQPPLRGFNGHDPLHTWAFRAYLDQTVATTQSILWLNEVLFKQAMYYMGAAFNGGAYSQLLVRRNQIISIANGKPVDKPIFMHSRAGHKLVAWLRRCVSEQQKKAVQEQQCNFELETCLLLTLSACCDPPGRDCLVLG